MTSQTRCAVVVIIYQHPATNVRYYNVSLPFTYVGIRTQSPQSLSNSNFL